MRPDITAPLAPPFTSGTTNRAGVLIVGAGPTGLALACDLRRRGIDVTVIDKASGPATTSRALGVQPRGTEILDRLGALGDLPQRAVAPVALSMFAGRRQLIHIPFPTPSAVNPNILIIGQSEVESQLRARLAELGCHVMWGTELVGAQDHGATVEMGVRADGADHVIAADWLVGCDGAHSKVRKLAGIGFDGTSFTETFLLADVRLDWERSRRETVAWLHADGMLGAMPLPGADIWRLMAELPSDASVIADQAGGSIAPTAAIELLQRLLQQRLDDTTTRISDPVWISLFRFHRRLASRYRTGRMIIAGDAAHIHSPFGGQGMNTGLGDAYNLGWKLAMVMSRNAGEHLIDSYEAERRPVGADVLKRTTNNTNLLLGKSTRSRLVRDHLFLPMMKLPAVQRKLAGNGSQLNVNYRGGPLAPLPGPLARLADLGRGGPRPGDRGPNAPCRVLPAGTATTLGAHTSAGWALLLFGEPGASQRACAAAARSSLGADLRVIQIVAADRAAPAHGKDDIDVVLEDHEGAIARAYRPGAAGLILLRPDGHVGWRSPHPAATKLGDWLRAVLSTDRAT